MEASIVKDTPVIGGGSQSGFSPVFWLSGILGIGEPALRLLLAVLFCYPVAVVHRNWIRSFPSALQHIFFIICGFSIAYFNFGLYAAHHVACVLALHGTLCIFGGTVLSVSIAFVFQLGYLLMGYVFYQTRNYDITWCTSHCVLTLKLIGVAFDYYDGCKDERLVRPDQKNTRLTVRPSLLELAGHAFFPCTMVVGPQLSLTLYQQFINNTLKLPLNSAGLPDCVSHAINRLLYGCLYAVVYVLMLAFVVPNDYFFDSKFLETGFFHKVFWMTIWQRASFTRYMIVWLLAEGSCILIGLTYNGKDSSGKPRWDGLCNINIAGYENSRRIQDYVTSFNINTNNWSAKYVYKRLMFLGNKSASQALTLLFLAVWHGYHLGYFFVFFLEFLVVLWERKMESALRQYPSLLRALSVGWCWWLVDILLRTYTVVLFAYCVLPFLAVSRHKWWPLYLSIHCYGHVLFLSWPLAVPVLHRLMGALGVPRERPRAPSSAEHSTGPTASSTHKLE